MLLTTATNVMQHNIVNLFKTLYGVYMCARVHVVCSCACAHICFNVEAGRQCLVSSSHVLHILFGRQDLLLIQEFTDQLGWSCSELQEYACLCLPH